MTSCWGGDYVALYKQGLRLGLFERMKVATCQGFSNTPHSIGKDHPEGVLMGVHANYFFTTPNRAAAGPPTKDSWRPTSSAGKNTRRWRRRSAIRVYIF